MMTTLASRRLRILACTFTAAALSVASTGCEILLDFNRALIDSGIEGGLNGDGGFADAGFDALNASDSAVDALLVPDAVADVDHVEASSASDAGSSMDASHVDATTSDAAAGDAHADGSSDAGAHADGTTPHDGAAHDGAEGDAARDGAESDGANKG